VRGRPTPARPRVVWLSPGREGRRRLAIEHAFDAREGDPVLYRRRLEELVDLHFRLVAEQRAESGYMPTTVEGCVAVLGVAERILRVIGGAEIAGFACGEERSTR
jgi:hypothetical protein